jgi:hypothetical protein
MQFIYTYQSSHVNPGGVLFGGGGTQRHHGIEKKLALREHRLAVDRAQRPDELHARLHMVSMFPSSV